MLSGVVRVAFAGEKEMGRVVGTGGEVDEGGLFLDNDDGRRGGEKERVQ